MRLFHVLLLAVLTIIAFELGIVMMKLSTPAAQAQTLPQNPLPRATTRPVEFRPYPGPVYYFDHAPNGRDVVQCYALQVGGSLSCTK
jgi:hypothetical protein